MAKQVAGDDVLRGAPPIPNLADEGVREQLTPAAVKGIVRQFEHWGLNAQEACALLGGISESTWYRMKKRSYAVLSQDELTRISALLGIFKGLRLLLSEPLADEWITRPNSNPIFGGKRPVDAMAEGGIPAMLRTRAYLDAMRGGA